LTCEEIWNLSEQAIARYYALLFFTKQVYNELKAIYSEALKVAELGSALTHETDVEEVFTFSFLSIFPFSSFLLFFFSFYFPFASNFIMFPFI